MKAMRPFAVLAALSIAISSSNTAGADDSLDRVKQAGELVIAVDPTYPPMEFELAGELRGFDIDIAHELAQRLGVKPRFERLEFTAIIAGLNSKRYDMVISSMNVTDQRKQEVDFVEYARMSQVFVCNQSGTAVSSEADLKGRVVALQVDTTSHTWAKALNEAVSAFLGTHAFEIETFEDGQHAFEYLKSRADAVVITDEPVGRYYAKTDPTFVVTGRAIEPEPIGIAVRKQDQALQQAIADALKAMKQDGTFAAIETEWFGSELGHDPRQRTGLLAFIWKEVTPRILRGMWWTIALTLCSGVLGVLLGLLLSLARISRNRLIAGVASGYVTLFRGTPLLLQILFVFFALPMLINVRLDAVVAGVLALTFNAAAYLTENFRSAIQSIDKGQMEAARALGMSYAQAMRRIILPQTWRRLIPQLVNQLAALSKDTSLVMVIGVAEMLYETKRLAAAFLRPEVYICAGFGYLVIVLLLTWFAGRLEQRLEAREA